MKWILILTLSCLPAMAVTKIEHKVVEPKGMTRTMTKTGAIVGIYTIASDYGVEYLEIISKTKGATGLFLYNTYDEYGYYAYGQLGFFIGRKIIFTEIGTDTSWLYIFNLVKPRASGVVIYNYISSAGTIFSAEPAVAVKQ